MHRFFPALAVLLSVALAASAAQAQLRGHGGPVKSHRDLARRHGNQSQAASTSRRSAGRSSATPPSRCCASTRARSTRPRCCRTAAPSPAARMAASRSGARGRASRSACLKAIRGRWSRSRCRPTARRSLRLPGTARARLWPLNGGEPRVLEGHQQNVNGIAFMPDGRALVTRGLRPDRAHLAAKARRAPIITTLPTPLNAVAVAPDGEIAAGGADGKVWFLSPTGEVRGSIDAGGTPVIARRDLRRWRAGRGRWHPRRHRDHRQEGAHGRAHAGRPRPAGVVARLRARQPHADHRRHRPHDPPLGRGDRRPRRLGRDGGGRRPARSLRRRPRRRGFSCLRRLPHADAGRGQPRRPDARGHFRPPHRDAAGLSIFRAAQAAWTSCGRRRRWRSCSRSGRPPIRPAPKCRSSGSPRGKIERRWWGSWSARRKSLEF